MNDNLGLFVLVMSVVIYFRAMMCYKILDYLFSNIDMDLITKIMEKK